MTVIDSFALAGPIALASNWGGSSLPGIGTSLFGDAIVDLGSPLGAAAHLGPASPGVDAAQLSGFSVLQAITPRIETVPLEDAAAGYERMLSGEPRFRVVLTTGK